MGSIHDVQFLHHLYVLLFYINDNRRLTNLNDLSNLAEVDEVIMLNNINLTNINGLNGITSFSKMTFVSNDSLTDFCSLTNVLKGISDAQSFGTIYNKYNPSFEDMQAGRCSE